MDTTLPNDTADEATEINDSGAQSDDAKTTESVRRFFDASNSSMMGGWT